MKIVKSFEEYIKEGIVRKVSENKNRAESIINEADRKMRTLMLNLEKVGIINDNASDYVEHCYDILMLTLRAKMHSEGFISSGRGSDEAEIAYLRILGATDKEIFTIDELRYLRNGILYYGTSIDVEYSKGIINFTKQTFPKLRKLALESMR